MKARDTERESSLSARHDDWVYYTYETEIGNIVIVSDGASIKVVKFGSTVGIGCKKASNALTDQAARQLDEYLSEKRKCFDVPLSPCGTAFQRSVWNALLSIPYGETRSYKQVAQMIGNPKACRAVGMANNRNPIIIMIPCHRVIGSDGSLVGYGGGLDIKKKLLALERSC